MAMWSKKSKSSNQGGEFGSAMVGGLSVDAHSAERRAAAAGATQAADLTVKDYMTGVPTIRLSSLFKALVKQIWWVILAFLLGSAAIYHFTKDIQRTYRAEGRLLVQIGPEYIYTPVGGTNATSNQGVAQTPDTIALNEVGIIKNAEIITEVTGIITSARTTKYSETTLDTAQAQNLFAEKIYEKIAKEENLARQTGDYAPVNEAKAELNKMMNESYYVAPQPKSSLIDISFKHEDPEVAIETLNLFIDTYQERRKILFVDGAEDTIGDSLQLTEQLLTENEMAIARFLERNEISDFTSVQTGLRERSEALKAELNTLRGDMSETEGSLARVEDQLRGTEPTINLYVDDRASQRVAQAELELKQLLAKYLPSSDPVRQKRTELEELKALQGANNGRAAGGRRVGPNPNYQELVTSRNTLQSTANSLREKEVTLQGQLNSAVTKVRRLTQLSPEYQNLLRKRKTLSAALDTYNARSQEAEVNLAQEGDSNENIKVISRPSSISDAIKGQNTGKLIWAGGSLAWGLTLLMLALLRVFLDPKNFSAPSTTRKGPRRSRSTDRPSHKDGGNIPEPLSPYDVRTPMTASATGGGAVAATRAYNAAAKASDDASVAVSEASQPAHHPQEFNAEAYQGVNYQATGYTGDTPYGNPYMEAIQPQVYSTEQQTAIDMQANPYLQPQPKKDDLPVLGSFSMAKG